MPEHVDTIADNLWRWLDANFKSIETHDVANVIAAGQRHFQSLRLQELYGKEVLPDALLQEMNGGLSHAVHLKEEGGSDDGVLQESLFLTLHKLLLKTQDHPVIARFWLFADSVWTLCRWKLCGIPSSIVQSGAKVPQPLTQKRLKKVISWLDAEESGANVRIASLCLRLCARATQITGQKLRTRDSNEMQRVPLMVRLARGAHTHNTHTHTHAHTHTRTHTHTHDRSSGRETEMKWNACL
eukprot:6468649-Amphidinium_carterae.1